MTDQEKADEAMAIVSEVVLKSFPGLVDSDGKIWGENRQKYLRIMGQTLAGKELWE